MKKYNCFEELKEQFQPLESFECEGETFKMIDYTSFRVDTPLNTVMIKNTIDGIKVCLYLNYRCIEYFYKSVQNNLQS